MSVIEDAALTASLFAVDPAGLGGVLIRSPVHPLRDRWLSLLREMLPPQSPLRRVPYNIPDDRLLGGLDLIATLKANRPVASRGLLAEADGGVIVLPMAERLSAHTAARISATLDSEEVCTAREGVSLRHPARLGLVVLDEGATEEEHAPTGLLDRCAFLLDFSGIRAAAELMPMHAPEEIVTARTFLDRVEAPAQWVQALCATALALGVGSPRVSLLALRLARTAAALDGRCELSEDDATLAARLVLAPRATVIPDTRPQEESASDPPPPKDPVESPQDSQPADSADQREPQRLEDIVLAAAQSGIPAGLLARLRSVGANRSRRMAAGGRAVPLARLRDGAGRQGVLAGGPRRNARLNVIETLRAAAPWQGVRRRMSSVERRLYILPEDFRITRYKQRSPTVTIFAVDASGSSALNRLAEAKGAVELLLADCYVRRDQVAVIAFRGRAAELLLPPTRSLVRAKRSLAGLPGGGGTPLTAGIEAALALAGLAQRRGETPTLVMLTDGRANVSRDGRPGREGAHVEAMTAAAAVRAARISALFVDTSPRPQALAQELAQRMNAHYIPLPFANARALNEAVKAAAGR